MGNNRRSISVSQKRASHSVRENTFWSGTPTPTAPTAQIRNINSNDTTKLINNNTGSSDPNLQSKESKESKESLSAETAPKNITHIQPTTISSNNSTNNRDQLAAHINLSPDREQKESNIINITSLSNDDLPDIIITNPSNATNHSGFPDTPTGFGAITSNLTMKINNSPTNTTNKGSGHSGESPLSQTPLLGDHDRDNNNNKHRGSGKEKRTHYLAYEDDEFQNKRYVHKGIHDKLVWYKYIEKLLP
eukprot:297627_1